MMNALRKVVGANSDLVLVVLMICILIVLFMPLDPINSTRWS